MIHRLRFIFESTLQVVYPSSCCVCDKDLVVSERHICAGCAYDLPYITENEQNSTHLSKLFLGRVEIGAVYSLLSFKKGNNVQSILHKVKYKNRPKMATYLGAVLAKSVPVNHGFTMVVPIPLHPKKLQKRGFNQSTAIAKGLAEVLNLPVNEKCVRRNSYNESQTKFSRYDRYENVRSIFTATQPHRLKGHHILLVDDVLTTGATIEACAAELLTAAECKVSIATLAATIH